MTDFFWVFFYSGSTVKRRRFVHIFCVAFFVFCNCLQKVVIMTRKSHLLLSHVWYLKALSVDQFSFHINIAIKVIVLTLLFVIKEPIVKTIYISENVGHV